MPRIRPLPDGRVEVFRTASVGVRGGTVVCPGCQRTLYIVFDLRQNAEWRECCGYQFRLEVMRVDLATYKLPGDPKTEFLSAKTPFEAQAT